MRASAKQGARHPMAVNNPITGINTSAHNDLAPHKLLETFPPSKTSGAQQMNIG
jgi:hypothetical protein